MVHLMIWMLFLKVVHCVRLLTPGKLACKDTMGFLRVPGNPVPQSAINSQSELFEVLEYHGKHLLASVYKN